MRLMFLTLLMAVMSAGCDSRTLSDTDANKAAVTEMIEQGWNEGRLEVFSATMADPVVFHYAGTPRTLSLEEMNGFVLRWREAFPDLEMRIEELIAEDDIVAARLVLTGTHEGSWRGLAPTGREVSMALMMFFRFEDGLMVELWESDDQAGLRRQLETEPD